MAKLRGESIQFETEQRVKTIPKNTIRQFVRWVAVFTALSWLGEYIHNRFELPGLSLLSPENSLMALAAMILFLAWWIYPSRLTSALLAALALLHLIGGGILSVIPFPFLPFYPEQTASHYRAHLFYSLAQLPLIISMLRRMGNIRAQTAHKTVT